MWLEFRYLSAISTHPFIPSFIKRIAHLLKSKAGQVLTAYGLRETNSERIRHRFKLLTFILALLFILDLISRIVMPINFRSPFFPLKKWAKILKVSFKPFLKFIYHKGIFRLTFEGHEFLRVILQCLLTLQLKKIPLFFRCLWAIAKHVYRSRIIWSVHHQLPLPICSRGRRAIDPLSIKVSK